MSKKSKKEYVEILRRRYRKAKNNKDKSKIIDELQSVCKYNRKYAIRVLNSNEIVDLRNKKKAKRNRKPFYGNKAIQMIKMIWELADYPCGIILKKIIPLWLPFLRNDYAIDPATEKQMLKISAAQIDRRISKHKREKKKKLYGTTKPGSLLRNQIPISTNHWDVDKPGYTEMDTVAHCGANNDGHFANTVNCMDIQTFWVERRSILGKGQYVTCSAIEEIDNAFPFKVVAKDCDNGGEFINYHMVDYCKLNNMSLTRSRPYRKNDNAYIEQKNWTHVRKIFGYKRIDSQALVDQMNDLYKNELRLFHNFFCPNRKLIEKIKKGTKTIRIYDKPQTPYERVLLCKHVSQNKKKELKFIFDKLNPVHLRIAINRKIDAILGYIS